ncbi:MAG: cob(I)yrinic acid a,c-diamide adenosyltransferase [Acidaminococcaceae bacterium]|nr:cob(I)yrinic acid a,c-diamide adenosyltransferase [Acidaminococcaceae bacterium]
MLQIYTGNGKGKTTAALGAALRGAGKGLKTIFFAFLKGDVNYGEVLAADKLNFLDIRLVGRDAFVNFRQPEQVDLDMAAMGWAEAKDAILNRSADIIVLDEFNLLLATKMLPLQEVAGFLEEHKNDMEIIVTGRGAPAELVGIGDLVTDMQEVKHYLALGFVAREGFDH